MRDVLKGEKKVSPKLTLQAFRKSEIKPITVPQYAELGPRSIYRKIESNLPGIVEYLPDYGDDTPSFVPQKQFMWDIYNTLDEENANAYIKYAIAQRFKEKEEGDKTVDIYEEVWNEIKQLEYFSKKKGKALFMLKSNKKFSQNSRKRRHRDIVAYRPDDPELYKWKPQRRIKDTEMELRTPSKKAFSAKKLSLDAQSQEDGRGYTPLTPNRKIISRNNPFTEKINRLK